MERWVDSAAPQPTKSKSKSAKEPTPARFIGGGGLTTGKTSAVGKRNSHKEKVAGKSKMHAWCVFDGHDMQGEAAAQIAAQTFEQHLSAVRDLYTSECVEIGAWCSWEGNRLTSAFQRIGGVRLADKKAGRVRRCLGSAGPSFGQAWRHSEAFFTETPS